MQSVTARVRCFAHTAILAIVAVVAASCGREPTGAAGGFLQTSLDFRPAFQTSTAGLPGDQVTRIEITVYVINTSLPAGAAGRRRVLTTLKLDPADTKRVVETDDNISITVAFQLQGAESVYEIEVGAYDAAGTLLYEIPPVQFTEKQIGSSAGVAVTGTATYVGPGANATRIEITPPALTLKPGEQGMFTATAFTAANVPIAKAPLRWRSMDNQVASFQDQRSGIVRAGGLGRTDVTVMIEGTQVAASATLIVALTPTDLIVAQGAGQTAAAGDPLPQPVRVRLVAGGTPVSGATITFSTPSGGSLSPSSATTNGIGEAETRWTLGPGPGTQTLVASSAGVPSVTISATAAPRPSTVSIVSVVPPGIAVGGSATIVAQVMQDGQPNGGAEVNFVVTPAVGAAVSPTKVTTAANGHASTTFTATQPGSYSVVAQVGNNASAAVTVVVSQSTAVTQLVKVGGDNQSAAPGSSFALPLIVQALNAQGAPVAGAAIEFDGGGAKIPVTTDANGLVAVVFNVSAASTPGVVGQIVVTLVAKPAIKVAFTWTVANP